MKDLEIRTRKWVTKYDGKKGKINAEILKKILVLKQILWNGDLEPFEWWVSGLLGIIPGDIAIFRALGACLKAENERKVVGNILGLSSAIQAIQYYQRKENNKCRVLLYENPSKIPAGSIHLFDLTAGDLEKGLKIVIKTHGIKEQEKFFLKISETTPELPEKKRADPGNPYYHKAKAEKHAVLDAQNKHYKKLGISATPAGAKKLENLVETLFNSETMKIAEERLAEINQKYAKEVPQKDKYKAEQIKTLAAGEKNGKNSAPKIIQEQMLKITSGIFPGMGEFFSQMVSQVAQEPSRAGPDELYRLERELFACRKEVQRQCSIHKGSLNLAFEASMKKYANLTLDLFNEYRKFPESNFIDSLTEAAKALKYDGFSYAERVYKQARSNARINEIWAEYLTAAYPLADPVTIENIPDTPPFKIRCNYLPQN